MNELKKFHINELATKYIDEKDEAVFESLYRNLLLVTQPKLDYWISQTRILAGRHEIQAVFDDSVIKALSAFGKRNGDFVKLFTTLLHNEQKTLLRKLRTRRKYELYEVENSNEDAATFEIASEFNVEEHITAIKEADQRQLIDFLLSGENERVTGIIQTFLKLDCSGKSTWSFPTAKSIADELGIHHSAVSRTFKRLAAKFEQAKQFGSYQDYLVAL